VEAAPSRLAEAARGYAEGTSSAEELEAAFEAARVYCRAAEGPPGFLAVDDLVPVFSSEEELARFALARGEGDDVVAWFSTSGRDVLDLLPNGYGVALDPAGAHPLVLPASSITQSVVFRRAETPR
jgi:hypothetical protein